MSINTIILIEKDKNKKEYFIEKLRQRLEFSYTKIEALFQTIKETSDKESYEFKKEQYLEFLDKFLKNLSKKEERYLIDVDKLSVENANKLLEKHNNIIIIYLQKKQEEGNTIKIDVGNEEEVNKLIEYIVKKGILWKN
mgnify:CR=1 FL=1